MIYRFGRFELDEMRGELRRDCEAVRVQPKPFELLLALVSERERVVTADELLERLWPDATVTSASLARAVSHARRAIDDSGHGELIKSFSKRGYRFCGDVLEVVAGAEAPATAQSEVRIPNAEPFVGRGESLAKLRHGWSQAQNGQAGVAVITGPAGIGKTRLSEVFIDETRAQGARTLVGRARDSRGVPPLWLWAQVLRQLLEAKAVADPAAVLGANAGELWTLLPEFAPADAVREASADAQRNSGEQSRFLLFDGITRLLLQASREQPLVIVLEDLQWAGQEALGLLEHVVFEVEASRILIVGTVRDERRERNHPLNKTLDLLRRRPSTEHIDLVGFSRGEVAALLERATGEVAPADLISQLFARTEGVPLFVREAIRLLRERGSLLQQADASASAMLLPLQSLDLIHRSLGTLSSAAASTIEAAAVIGRDFSVRFAAAVADIDPSVALERLDEAVHCGVVEPSPEQAGSFRFCHSLFQEAVVESLTAGSRARLHQRAAAHLETRYGDDLEPVISELADHALRGIAVGEPESAYEYALQAARQARRVYAFEQAAQHYEQALSALDHFERDDYAKRIEAWLGLAVVLRLAGERRRRFDVLRRALARARSLSRHDDFARAAIAYCDISDWTPRDDEGREILGEALAGLDSSATRERARLMSRLAFFALPRSREEGEAIARKALGLARNQDDDETLHEALYALHYCVAGPDNLGEREEIAAELAQDARRASNREPALIALLDVASDRLALGQGDAAAQAREQAGRLVSDGGYLGLQWNLQTYDAGLAHLLGDFERAQKLQDEGYAMGLRLSHPYTQTFFGGQRARLGFDVGEFDWVEECLAPAIPVRAGPDAYVAALLGRARLRMGRREDAERLYETIAPDGFDQVPRNIRWMTSLVEVSLLCAELGDGDRAPELTRLLRPFAHCHGVFPIVICYGGPLSRALARLAQVEGRIDDAIGLFGEALDAARAISARPMEAVLCLEYAQALGTQRAARSRPFLERAHVLASELGLGEVEEQAKQAFER